MTKGKPQVPPTLEELGEVAITPEDAERVLQEKRTERVRAVEQGIQDLCNAHRCVIDIQMTFSMYGKPQGRIVVIPRD